jgi:hypothetical protein
VRCSAAFLHELLDADDLLILIDLRAQGRLRSRPPLHSVEDSYRFVNSRWLFAVLELFTIPLVVRLYSAVRTVAGDAVGLVCRYRAATPARAFEHPPSAERPDYDARGRR